MKLHFSAVSRSTDALPVGELMSKHQPVFFYEGLVALNSPIERVQEQLSHSTSLTCPVPTVATVDNHARPQDDGVGHVHRRLQHCPQMPQPLGLLNALEESLHGFRFLFAGLHQLSKRLSHHMDVLDPLEYKFCVWIERLGLVALASRPVCHGIDLWPCINYE